MFFFVKYFFFDGFPYWASHYSYSKDNWFCFLVSIVTTRVTTCVLCLCLYTPPHQHNCCHHHLSVYLWWHWSRAHPPQRAEDSPEQRNGNILQELALDPTLIDREAMNSAKNLLFIFLFIMYNTNQSPMLNKTLRYWVLNADNNLISIVVTCISKCSFECFPSACCCWNTDPFQTLSETPCKYDDML